MLFIRNYYRTPVTIGVSVMLILLVTGCSSLRSHPGDEWFARDKALHFTASTIIGAGATAIALNNGASIGEGPLIGLTASVCVGAGKEWYDRDLKNKYWSWKDFLWDIMGSAAGSYAVSGMR